MPHNEICFRFGVFQASNDLLLSCATKRVSVIIVLLITIIYRKFQYNFCVKSGEFVFELEENTVCC